MSSIDPNARYKEIFQNAKRVSNRKDGIVKISYTGKETAPSVKDTQKLTTKPVNYFISLVLEKQKVKV